VGLRTQTVCDDGALVVLIARPYRYMRTHTTVGRYRRRAPGDPVTER
jgi:hypothetical protein